MKTIVLLSAKRTGSTAFHNMFRKHRHTKICHVDQDIQFFDVYNWEPQFWSLGSKLIEGDREPFVKRFKPSHPYLKVPEKVDEETL